MNKRTSNRKKAESSKNSELMGSEGHSHLGAWFCRQSLDNLGLRRPASFYPALEQNYHPVGSDGRKHEVWKISHGKRSWDARRRCHPKTGGMALPVHLPEQDRQLFLVVPRPGYGRKPCYLITTQPISTAEQAWRISLAYARRWQIQMSLRFTKSEMAFESPRLTKCEARLKFLLIASLAYAFLLSLLPHTNFILNLISRYCHRTGKWSRDLSAPLYRLRLAISRLCLDLRPPPLH